MKICLYKKILNGGIFMPWGEKRTIFSVQHNHGEKIHGKEFNGDSIFLSLITRGTGLKWVAN